MITAIYVGLYISIVAVGMNTFYFVAVLAIGEFEVSRHHDDVRAAFWTMTVVTVACLITGLPIAVRAARRPRMLGRRVRKPAQLSDPATRSSTR